MRATMAVAVTVLLVACGGAGERPDPARDAGGGERPARGMDTAKAPASRAVSAPGRGSGSVPTAGTPSPPDTLPVAPPAVDARGGWTSGATVREGRGAGSATVTGLRIARHDGFDRLVLELREGWIPGYRIGFETGPLEQCGSGFAIEVAGDRPLRVLLEPAQAHTEQGEPTLGARRWRAELPVIREVLLTCDFEGQVEVVAGTSGGSRYRVLELTSPARLVIDVRSD